MAVEVAPTLPDSGGTTADGAVRVPGLLAALRRGPVTVPRASAAAIVAGAALFVVACVATPLAGAGSAAKPHHRPKATSAAPVALPQLPLSSTSAAPVLSSPPTRSPTKAPVDHGSISALAANGIPKVALNAYRVAAARMDHVDPGCGIDWSLIAGIGREESDHGRYGGAVLHADGTSTPRIIGPALDGRTWDFIPAPGNGLQLDGDAVYAHALGPMQFIPSTWAGYGADADGDGKADVFDINDAALGTARYLCAAGGNLRTLAGREKAVLAYNHNDRYLAQVLALADAYKRGVPITGIPVGNITGGLPTIVDTGYVPPANPGDPTAVGKKGKPTQKSGSPSPTHGGSPSSGPTGSGHGGGSTSTAPKSSPTHSGGTTSTPPRSGGTSSTPTPTPSPKHSCDPLTKLGDQLLPPDKQVCL